MVLVLVADLLLVLPGLGIAWVGGLCDLVVSGFLDLRVAWRGIVFVRLGW